MKTTDLAYMAGIFDGEGCISIFKYDASHSYSYGLDVCIGMANKYMPELFYLNFGGRLYGYQPKRGKYVWYWHIHSFEAGDFLETVLSYLRLKRNEAELAIEFLKGKKKEIPRSLRRYTEGERAVMEAQRILMQHMKDKSVFQPTTEAV